VEEKMAAIEQPTPEIPPIFIISGGAGALGKHVARIALSQFAGLNPQMIVIPQICSRDQVVEAIAQVVARHGIIIHTMVDPKIRQVLIQLAQEYQITAIDTIGNPLAELSMVLGQAPLGQPGLYQGGNETYLERIKAIEYTVDHDDGRSPNELAQAYVVLAGISRVGKTPLSIYLSVLGWRVANVPLVLDIQPPKELFAIDRRRVIGLTIDVEVLMQHRRWRQESFGWRAGHAYSDTEALYTEVEFGQRIFRKGGFSVINVTNKPIEETADQVIAMISRYFEHMVAH
jgi:[pyruvate, water dikinase]-phosphate phosphotransferase / [pyruvate, water dikinase] kinase